MPSDPETPLMQTLRRFEAAHARRSLGELRECFADDALIESVASEGRSLDPDASIEALRLAFDDVIYFVGDWSYQVLEPELVVSSNNTRYRGSTGHGVSHLAAYRLTRGRNGLMWRVKLFRSRADALAAVAELGHTLLI